MDHEFTDSESIDIKPKSPHDSHSLTIAEWGRLGLRKDIKRALASQGIHYLSQILTTEGTELISWDQFREKFRGRKQSPSWFHSLQDYASGGGDYTSEYCQRWCDAQRQFLEASDRESTVSSAEEDELEEDDGITYSGNDTSTDTGHDTGNDTGHDTGMEETEEESGADDIEPYPSVGSDIKTEDEMGTANTNIVQNLPLLTDLLIPKDENDKDYVLLGDNTDIKRDLMLGDVKIPDDRPDMSDSEAAYFYTQELARVTSLAPPRPPPARAWVATRRLIETVGERKARKQAFVEEMTRTYTFGPASHRDVQKEFREIDFEKLEKARDRAWVRDQQRVHQENERKRILQDQLDWMKQRDEVVSELRKRWFRRARKARLPGEAMPVLEGYNKGPSQEIVELNRILTEAGAGSETTSSKRKSPEKELVRELAKAVKKQKRQVRRAQAKRVKERALERAQLKEAAKRRLKSRQEKRQSYEGLESEALNERLMEEAIEVMDRQCTPLATIVAPDDGLTASQSTIDDDEDVKERIPIEILD
ncbi:hypothetical protein BGZ93_001540 [Podila epicladia]|nr:hypothetical protein BGZ92_008737 [Podila epicladia]KAG0097966.1 hypothetical protein BGZ93_001540 [Podila epicladia]